MNILFLVLCGIVTVSSLVFGISLFQVPLEERDFWLKVFSALLAVLVLAVGLAAVITSHVLNDALTREVAESAKAISDARTELARQQERAAVAEQSLLEMQERMRPRTLTSEQHAKAITALASAPKHVVTLSWASGDTESLSLANEIAIILKSAGWIFKEEGGFVRNPHPTGIQVKSKRPTPSSTALVGAFDLVGLAVTEIPVPNWPADRLEVIVGSKY